MRTMRSVVLAGLLVAGILLSGCSGTTTPTNPGATTSATPNPYPPPTSTTSVTGSGSSFAFPIIDAWRTVYGGAQPNVQVNYESKGSGTGKTNLKNGDDLFAGSDSPLSASDRAAYPTILTFPESLGPIAVVYNVPGAPDGLKLDGETIGKMYTGAITKWNDPAIAAANPGASLPATTITAVYRSDSSGTTFVFTDFLGKASPTWAATMGAAATQTPKWNQSAAQQSSGPQNDGVADKVNSIQGSIGYVELSYVKSKGLHAAAVKNPNGEYLLPTPDGATAAAASFATSLPAADGDWGKVSIVNAPGAGAYPISTFTYLMVKSHVSDYAGKFDANQMAGFKNFAWWALHDGQAYAKPLGYAPLPAPVVAIGEHALTLIS